MNEQGQVEIETILGIVAVLVIFIGVMAITSSRNAETEMLFSISNEKNECMGLASIISSMASNNGSSEITIPIDNDINLFSDHLSISGNSCDFFGTASPSQLSKGNVKIYESNGVVYAENA